MADASVDAIFSDVPYGIGSKQPSAEDLVAYLTGSELDTGGDFMAADWRIPSLPTWREFFRVLKPGGWMLIFAGSRTFDLIGLGIRAAGFTIHDSLEWFYARGLPKPIALTSTFIDDHLGVERPIIGSRVLTCSEAIGAVRAGWDLVIAVEREEDFVRIGEARLKRWCAIPAHIDPWETKPAKADERQRGLFE